MSLVVDRGQWLENALSGLFQSFSWKFGVPTLRNQVEEISKSRSHPFISNSTQELGFKLATFISSFLSEGGRERLELFKEIKRLYSERSRAAHGRMDRKLECAQASYLILRKVLRKIIEDGAIPSADDLEMRLRLSTEGGGS